jgi:colanic acid biosynthesis protein WcaH
VILNNKNEVLLCHRTNKPAQGTWWFPGGRVQKGETMREAIIRKVKQETGLEIRILEQLGTDETLFPDGPFDGPTHTINTVFLVTAKKKDPVTLDNQHDDLRWFNTFPKGGHPYVRKYLKSVWPQAT